MVKNFLIPFGRNALRVLVLESWNTSNVYKTFLQEVGFFQHVLFGFNWFYRILQ